jgi:hypothetical protein
MFSEIRTASTNNIIPANKISYRNCTNRAFQAFDRLCSRIVCSKPARSLELVHVFVLCMGRSRGSSVSIVSGYGLDDRAIEVRSPAEAKEFFL